MLEVYSHELAQYSIESHLQLICTTVTRFLMKIPNEVPKIPSQMGHFVLSMNSPVLLAPWPPHSLKAEDDNMYPKYIL